MGSTTARSGEATRPAADQVRQAGAAEPAAPRRTYRNPFIDCPGAADPTVLRYQGRYYLYPTTDCTGYDVFVSDDLVHWERKPKCYTDPRGGVWAPDVFHHAHGDGKVYLYYTADDPSAAEARPFPKLVGVAVADHPLGPFADQGVLVKGAIDAHLFRDDDGALYLYYVLLPGGFRIMVQPMADPLTPRGEAHEVIRPTEDWEKSHGHVTEGPWMLKRQGTFYLMYSGSGAMGPDYAIGYATANSPLGPFTKYPGNPIARRGNGIFGPGHHCTAEGPDGRLWLIYHQKNTEKVDWDRFLAMDPLWFDDQGVIHARLSRGTDEPAP
jgi:beta-xylosidase